MAALLIHAKQLKLECSVPSYKAALLQVRALTRDIGSLKEDLRREQQRREKAVQRAQAAEHLRTETETQLKQLQYCNK